MSPKVLVFTIIYLFSLSNPITLSTVHECESYLTRALVGVGLTLHPERKNARLVRTCPAVGVSADSISSILDGCVACYTYYK